jgi:hypothetical protein
MRVEHNELQNVPSSCSQGWIKLQIRKRKEKQEGNVGWVCTTIKIGGIYITKTGPKVKRRGNDLI